MTDAEIIEALEHCFTNEDCGLCPLFSKCPTSFKLEQYALDLINCQKAELENQSENFKRLVAEHRKLQTDYYSMQSTLAKMSMGVEQAKAEAIKEFAERLKPMLGFGRYTSYEEVDNLVKEMVGDAE